MIHVTCYTHLLSRVCNEIAEKNEAANEVVKFVKKVFEKCARRQEESSEMAIYAFAPATSIDVERFFSALKAFLEDRPCILEKTVDKLMFVRYNQHI